MKLLLLCASKLQCHHSSFCWAWGTTAAEPRSELHSTGASQMLHSCSFEESSPAGCHVLLGEALAPCAQPYLVRHPAVFPASHCRALELGTEQRLFSWMNSTQCSWGKHLGGCPILGKLLKASTQRKVTGYFGILEWEIT